jgi:hypothetical protein
MVWGRGSAGRRYQGLVRAVETSRKGVVVGVAALVVAVGATACEPIPPASDCLARPADHETTLSGTRRLQFKDADASHADWTYDARNLTSSAYPFSALYPLSVGGSSAQPHLCWVGGKVVGQQPRDLSWDTMKRRYDGAGLHITSADWYLIDGLRVDNVEDGIDPRGKEGQYPKQADGMVIRNAYFKYVRDDCVENDDIAGGLIVDSLFDGCYTGVSEQPDPIQSAYPAPAGEVLELDHVLLRLQMMPGPYGTHDPTVRGHGQLFKWYPQSNRLDIKDSIFLVQTQPNGGTADFPAGTTASNVTVVWLGKGPYPGSVPPGVTITTNRGVWDSARSKWLKRHGCSSFDSCTKLTAPAPY